MVLVEPFFSSFSRDFLDFCWTRLMKLLIPSDPQPLSLHCACARVLSRFSCVRLLVTLWTVAFQASLSVGFSRQEHWSGLSCPPPGDLPNPGTEPASLMSPALAGRFFTAAAAPKSLQSCPTPCDPMDCSPPDSSVHGTLQARTLEWVVMPSSRESSRPRDQNPVSCGSCTGRWVLYH